MTPPLVTSRTGHNDSKWRHCDQATHQESIFGTPLVRGNNRGAPKGDARLTGCYDRVEMAPPWER